MYFFPLPHEHGSLRPGVAAFGFGGSYRVDLYSDDGWKTVNGQAGKTPIASYTSDAVQLPLTFESMATATDLVANYPRDTTTPFNPASVASLLRSGTASLANLQWAAPVVPDGSAFRVSHLAEFFQGLLAGNAIGVVYPLQRWYNFTGNTPSSSSTQGTLPVSARPASISSKSYSEFDLWFSNRNGARIGLIHTYQCVVHPLHGDDQRPSPS